MTLIAPHITAFLQERLPIERRASGNTCDSYAYAFKLLFEYASGCLKTTPSQLHLEQIDAALVVQFLNHLETTRGNGPSSRNVRLTAIKSFMHYMEYRLPSALEPIRRILAIPTKKTEVCLVKHLTTEEIQMQHRAIPNAITDRKSTRLNSSHGYISYAVFCLKKKRTTQIQELRGE